MPIIISILFLLTFINIEIPGTTGYNCDDDSKGVLDTHEMAFQQGQIILRNDGYERIADFLSETDNIWGKSFLNTMKRGSADNDDPTVWNGSINHFMHPMNHAEYDGFWEFVLEPSYQAAQFCSYKFSDALVSWGDGSTDQKLSDAMYSLGWAAHMVQDLCVAHHAFGTGGGPVYSAHTSYEDWVSDNDHNYLVESGGIYYSDLPPTTKIYQPVHFEEGPGKFVDYNAHESFQYYLYVNDVVWEIDDENYELETVHDLPNDLDSSWNITYHDSEYIQIIFDRISLDLGDHLYIYDSSGTLKKDYTDMDSSDVDTGEIAGETLKLRLVTDSTNPSWGYRTEKVSINGQYGDEYELVTEALFPRAQRTTAGFIKYFFDRIDKNNPAAPELIGHGCGDGWSDDPSPYVSWDEPWDDSPLGIEKYEYRLGENGDWIEGESPVHFDEEINTTLFVRAYDAVHKTSTSSIPIRIDRTKPTNPDGAKSAGHNISEWSNNNTIRINLTGASDEFSGIGGYSYQWNNGIIEPDMIGEANATREIIKSSELADGEWYLNVKTVDRAGNWADGFYSTGPYRIDTSAPGIPLPDDNTDGWSSDDTPLFIWSAPSDISGLSGYYYKTDGFPWIFYSSTSVELAPQESGEHIFYVKAVDGAGNIGEAGTHVFFIDTDDPDLTISAPGSGQWLGNGTVEVRWEGMDNYSSARYEMKLDDGEYDDLGDADRKILNDLAEGPHSLRIRAYDGANNSMEKIVSFNIDLTPPGDLSLKLKGKEIKTFSLSIDLDVHAVDEASSLGEMCFSNDGTSWSPWENWTGRKRGWNLSDYGGNVHGGQKTFYLKVQDKVGNVAVTNANVYYYPPLSRIELKDREISLRGGKSYQFEVSAYDVNGEPIAGGEMIYEWEVEGGIGSIDENGFFTSRKKVASATAGKITVSGTFNGVTRYDHIKVTLEKSTETSSTFRTKVQGGMCIIIPVILVLFIGAGLSIFFIKRRRWKKSGKIDKVTADEIAMGMQCPSSTGYNNGFDPEKLINGNDNTENELDDSSLFAAILGDYSEK